MEAALPIWSVQNNNHTHTTQKQSTCVSNSVCIKQRKQNRGSLTGDGGLPPMGRIGGLVNNCLPGSAGDWMCMHNSQCNDST